MWKEVSVTQYMMQSLHLSVISVVFGGILWLLSWSSFRLLYH